MKMKSVVLVFILAATVGSAQTTNLTSLLQQGLLEEQANRNLDAAIANYQTLAAQFDKDRQLAATAVFRIGECYRMQGKTNEAAAQYQRVLQNFVDQTTLATLSRQNLAGMGLAPGDNGKTVQAASEDSAEMRALAQQIAGIEKLKSNPTEYAQAVQAIFPNESLKKMLENLPNLQGFEVKLKAKSKVSYGDYCVAVHGENDIAGVGSLIASEPTNLLATVELELQKQNSWIAERVDFIMGIQKARLKVLQSAAGSTMASDATQNDGSPVTTDEEDQEIRRIQQMIQNSPDLINVRVPGGGGTPLEKAATAGWIKVATYLLDHGADVNADSGQALNNAAKAGNRAMVELLISRGAEVNPSQNSDNTPLHIAAQNGFQSVVEVLLANKADVNAQIGPADLTPLFLAAGNSNPKIVAMLLEHKAEVNVAVLSGATPLVNAAYSGRLEIVKLLLAAGANPNVQTVSPPNGLMGSDYYGRTPLSFAAGNNSPEMVKMLLAAKADPNGGKLNVPLLAAINKKDWASAELLLQAGANPNAKGDFDWRGGNKGQTTPLSLAISTKQFPLVQLLLKFKADPNISPIDGQPLLFSAFSDTNILEALLDAGAKVDARDSTTATSDHRGLNWTPLLYALVTYNPPSADVVEILLKHGANPNLRDGSYGLTPLHWSVGWGNNRLPNRKILELLFDYKADPNVRDFDGQTPLDRFKKLSTSNDLSPEQKIVAGQLADFLRQHGALDKLPDWDRITVSRPSVNFSKPLFYKGSNDWNQVSLYDLIGVQYDLLTSAWAGKTRTVIDRYGTFPVTTDLPFPDFTSVIIHHPSPDGLKWETRKIDLAAALNSNDCGRDVRLQFGDVVEIPEANHILNQSWNGLSTNQLAALKTCLTRHLQITVNGQATNFVVAPQITFGLLTGATFAERLKNLNQVQLTTFEPFMLWPVLDESRTLLSSSDLAQVKVKRTDAATGKVREWIVDCSDPKSPPNFWLRDGDEIEVPERR